MAEYNFYADLLNKYSQLTPWVQAVIGLGLFSTMIGLAYFIKESVVAIMKPLHRIDKLNIISNPEVKREWKDKYYRE